MNSWLILQCLLLYSTAHLSESIQLMKTDVIGQKAVTVDPAIDYRQEYYSVPVDHFGYANEDQFELRYLINDQWWGGDGAPVFFYAGNEGDIEWFCNNTGLMWAWGPEFKAMLIFVEHRYYGKSLPYGKDSYKDKSSLGYLTSEQALADFAEVLLHLRATTPGMESSPIIAFGGSYGGMLATWMRMKYPNVVEGALAASAPVLWFGDLTPCESFMKTVTADFAKSGPHCVDNVKASWSVIDEKAKTEQGRKELKDSLHLCDDISEPSDAGKIKAWLEGTYGNLAMVDYPYPANFLEPLPAWPIKEVCKHLNLPSPDDTSLLKGLGQAVGVYYNFTGQAKCFNLSQQAVASLGDAGWQFQACTEMVMPMCSRGGTTDMFEASPWDLKAFADGCKAQFNITTRPDWAITEYGGKNITAHSNIIFSNGELDPWSGGGVLESLSDTLTAILIEDGAHHLDLRTPRPDDPESVVSARRQEKTIIQTWIMNYGQNTYQESLFSSYSIPLAQAVPGLSTGFGKVGRGSILLTIGIIVTIVCLAVFFTTKVGRRTPPSNSPHHLTQNAPLLTEDSGKVLDEESAPLL